MFGARICSSGFSTLGGHWAPVTEPFPPRYCEGMCGRFVQYSDPDIYASHFHAVTLFDAKPRYNLAPTQPVLVVRQSDETRELVSLRWGLVPSWSKGPDNRYSMINARAETVDTKPAYRNAFKYRRCLIPAEGFYEWKKDGRGKTPFLIRRKNGAPFGMAGLWERWHGKDNETIESCTIIVTEANAPVRGRSTTGCRSSSRPRITPPGSTPTTATPRGFGSCFAPLTQSPGRSARSRAK